MAILYIINGGGYAQKKPEYIPVCERDIEQVGDAKKRIDILMGCSTINGKQVYTERKLERLWKEATQKKDKPPADK
jgi:hypothetical protein